MSTERSGKPIRLYQEDGRFQDYSTEELVALGLNRFKGWRCAAGVKSLCISFDGDVQSASCGAVGRKGAIGSFGNIYEDFELDDEWVVCPYSFCSCGADLFIPKVQDEHFKAQLTFSHGFAPQSTAQATSSVLHPVAVERTIRGQMKQVFWEIGRRCNFDCSYCHSYVHNNYEEHKSLEMLNFATKQLTKFAGGEKLSFSISGGEPTLNPDYLGWVRGLTEQGHHVSTHSNGSRPADYYRELIKLSDINLSVHFEFYQPHRLLEVISAILEEIQLAKSQATAVGHLEIMLMMPPGQSSTVQSFEAHLWELCHISHATVTLMPIRGHESIDQKTQRTGDMLLPQYQAEENAMCGPRSPGKLAQELLLTQLAPFHEIDQLATAELRQKAYQELLKQDVKPD